MVRTAPMTDPRDGMNRVTTIAGTVLVLPIDEDISYAFADLKNALVVTNLLIPDNDIWIAATAMAYGLTLIARDAHFARLAPYGLVHQQW